MGKKVTEGHWNLNDKKLLTYAGMIPLVVISERDQAYGNTLQVWTDGWSELIRR